MRTLPTTPTVVTLVTIEFIEQIAVHYVVSFRKYEAGHRQT